MIFIFFWLYYIQSIKDDYFYSLHFTQMKNTTFKKVKEYILDFTSIEDLKADLKNCTPVEMVRGWSFACYNSQALEALRGFYGSDFDESRYINKDWSWKYKNGECYAWTIYTHNVAMAIEKMARSF